MQSYPNAVPHLFRQSSALAEEEQALSQNPLAFGSLQHIVVLSKLTALLELWIEMTPWEGVSTNCEAQKKIYDGRLSDALKLLQAA